MAVTRRRIIRYPLTVAAAVPPPPGPADITGMIDWWTSADTSKITLSGSNVTAMVGQLGVLTLATAGFPPTSGINTINGHNVLDMATTFWLQCTISDLPQPFTIFAVYRLDSSNTVIQTSGGVVMTRGANYGLYAGADITGTAVGATTVSQIVVPNGASSASYLNGASDATGDAGTNTSGTTFRVGGDGGSHFMTGKVCAVGLAAGAADATARGIWNTYSQSEWATP